MRSKAADLPCFWIMTLGETRQFIPVAALFSCAVTAASKEEKTVIVSEGQSVLCLVYVHSSDIGRIFQRQHVGTVLIELKKIPAVFVQDRKVCGDNDLFGINFSSIGTGVVRCQFENLGVLQNIEIFGNSIQKFQRMKLCLSADLDRTCRRKGQGEIRGKGRGTSQTLQGANFALDGMSVMRRVYKRILFFKIAGNRLAQVAVLRDCPSVGVPIPSCVFDAEGADKSVVEQAVLQGDFCCCVLGNAACDRICFYKNIAYAGLL